MMIAALQEQLTIWAKVNATLTVIWYAPLYVHLAHLAKDGDREPHVLVALALDWIAIIVIELNSNIGCVLAGSVVAARRAAFITRL
eukprot:COSAG06_NODE_50759_length_316_cov_1.027650_1_plen_85_part_10